MLGLADTSVVETPTRFPHPLGTDRKYSLSHDKGQETGKSTNEAFFPIAPAGYLSLSSSSSYFSINKFLMSS